MATIGTIKKQILAFMNRDLTTFTVDSVDHVLTALNMSKEYAQQVVDFQKGLQSFSIDLSSAGTSGVNISSLTAEDTNTYRIKKPKLFYSDDWDLVPFVTPQDRITGQYPTAIMQRGDYIYPIGTLGTVKMLAYTFLADYTSDANTDYLTQNCQTWLTYSSIGHLNMFLKEDQRIQLSNTLISTAWQAVITWNERLEENADSLDLD